MIDHTYDREIIRKNPVWALAFVMSECDNDRAPMGWSKYISLAESLRHHYEITPKSDFVKGDAS